MKFGKRVPTEAMVEALPESRQGALHNGRGNERADMRAAAMAAEEPAAYVQSNDDPLLVGGPMPKTIGRCADLYAEVRALRLAMDKEVEAVKARESQIREYIIANLSKSDDSGAAGLRYRAQIVTKDVPRAMDWAAIHQYIKQTGRFDLLQKRLGEKAVMDMLEDKQTIPGVELVKIPDVSITKIGK